jgi:hypothetical protein
MDGMETKFIEPTASGRLKLVLCVLLGLGLNVVMDRWWNPFMEFVRSLPTCESLLWLRGIVIGFAVLGLLTALVAARAATLTLRSGQSPFQGAWVWSRVKVRTGWKAKADGYGFALGALLCLLGPAVGGYLLQVNVIFCWPVSCGC